MATTFVGVESESNSSNNTAGDLTVDVPAGVQNGDVLFAFVYKAANSVHTLTAPAGWTQIGSTVDTTNINGSVWRRTASSEPASYTWQISSTGIWGVAQLAFRGVDTTAVVHQNAGASYTSTDPATAPEITTSVPATIITCRGSRDDSTTEVTHTIDVGTEAVDWGFDGGAGTRNGAVYYELDAPAGTYARVVNSTGSVTNGVMFSVALTTLATEKVGADTASGAESASVDTPDKAGADTATGVEEVSSLSVSMADTATGVDSAENEDGVKEGADTATAVEQVVSIDGQPISNRRRVIVQEETRLTEVAEESRTFTVDEEPRITVVESDVENYV